MKTLKSVTAITNEMIESVSNKIVITEDEKLVQDAYILELENILENVTTDNAGSIEIPINYELLNKTLPSSEEEILNIAKEDAIKHLKYGNTANDPVDVNGVIFNGGNNSANVIMAAVELSIELSETELQLWDIDNKLHTFTVAEAKNVSVQIAVAYRTAMINKQALETAVNEASTIEEVNSF